MPGMDVSERVDSGAAGIDAESDNDDLYIVGIGASAGGLESLEQIFQAMPENTGMAFVIVQHLSPDFKSLMDELLARHTRMPIYRVADGMKVQPNALYLLPPKQEMIISDGKLLLTEKDAGQLLSLPIDRFFRSLAQDAGPRGIAVVLSGTGSDGSRGICDVREAGGLVVVQTPESAKFNGMPKSAVDTGMVDVEVEPSKIPEVLQRYAARPLRTELRGFEKPPVDESSLEHIFRLLQQRHKIDFNYYKPTTIGRRIERRIQLNHHGELEEYVMRLEDDPGEVDQLYKDLLIGVTRFFRDRAAFETLRDEALSPLLLSHDANDEFRVWVAGCGTGEEAYSLAILIDECMRAMNRRHSVKIFATDVHQASLDFAHSGVYPETSLEEMTTESWRKYFSKTKGGYQVDPEIRKMIVFAPHNLVKDAPFTHLNLVTCRNLLIYLRPIAQKKVFSLFHFALKTGGAMFLGPSESPGELAEEFETVNERWKIYRKRRDLRLPTDFRGTLGYQAPTMRETRTLAERISPLYRGRELNATYDALLDKYMPPAILIDERWSVLHSFAGAGRFLKVGDGRISTSILDLVDRDLKLALTGALQRVAKTEEPVSCERIRINTQAEESAVRLEIRPIRNRAASKQFLVILSSLDRPQSDNDQNVDTIDLDEASRHRIRDLEQELRYSKENLQSAVEELETSNEELQATNEELVASNEELQSTNEELHSVNEELYTVNAEYQRKIGELTELTNDMDNLLFSTKVHTLFLDKQLCIRKFTPEMARVFNLINSDTGRRIDGFTHRLACQGLLEKLARALAGEEHDEEVQDHDGNHYLMRILPYWSNKQAEGVVLTLVDITQRKAAEQELSLSKESLGQERSRLQTVLDQSLCMIYLKDREGRYVEMNQFGAYHMGRSRAELIGRTDLEILGQAGAAAHQADLQVISKGQQQIGEVVVPTPSGQRVFYTLKSPLRDAHGDVVGTCGIAVDITERKEAEASLAQEIKRRDEFLAMLSHELRNPMGAVLNSLEVLKHQQQVTSMADDGPAQVIARQTRHMARLLDDLLDVARLGQNKIEFRKEVIDVVALADDVLEAVGHEVQTRDQKLHVKIADGPLLVLADPARIKQAQVNLLANASKYTPCGGDIWYEIHREQDQALITVRDSGEGIPDELLGSIFDLFVQSESNLARSSGGMGVGLSLARSIVQAHAGTIAAESAGPGCGSTFRIRLPLTARPVKAKPPAPHFSIGKCKLLLVEDNHDARTMLAKSLRLRGFEVADVGDGEAALTLFRSFQPDVAVVDIGLPVMDGYQMARQVRRTKELNDTMLIALTGYGRESDRQAAIEAGFDAHLVKPLDPTELYSLIFQRRAAQKTS